MAGSEASIPPLAGSVPRRRSGSSSPCSHASSGGSRHPVSALKKWLANPGRKPNPDAAGRVGKVEMEACGSDRSAPPPPLPPLFSQAETEPRPLRSPRSYAALPSGESVRPKSPDRADNTVCCLAVILSSFPVKSVILQLILKMKQRGFLPVSSLVRFRVRSRSQK